MFGLFIKKTTWRKDADLTDWPLVYSTYHQELESPFRHAAWCLVIRWHRKAHSGLILGRYTHALPDEDTAVVAALQARPVTPFWWGADEEAEEPDDGSFGCMVRAGVS